MKVNIPKVKKHRYQGYGFYKKPSEADHFFAGVQPDWNDPKVYGILKADFRRSLPVS